MEYIFYDYIYEQHIKFLILQFCYSKHFIYQT